MRRKEQIKRFNLSIVSICLFIIMGIGVAYAVFSYNKLGNNNEFLMGKVYLNYFENANIALTSALPENATSARNNHGKKLVTYNGVPITLHDNEILFSLDGINESNKDFYFDFYLNEGDSIDGKDRIDPQYVRYDFIRIESNGGESLLISDKPVMNLNEKCLYSDILSAYSEIPSTMYKIRIWISQDVTWGDFGLYSYEEFENLYFSAKVSVIGDYSKTIKSVNTGEIEDDIGNLFAPLVYEMEIGSVSAQEYSNYYKQFIGVGSNGSVGLTQMDNSQLVRKIGDGVFEVYERNSNGTYKLKIVSDTNIVFPEDCSNLFTNFTNLRRITFGGIDTSNVTDMSGMFKDLEFLYRADLSNFDTSNVTSMKEMFANSGIYDVNLGSIDISSLTDSSYMFYNCPLLSKIYCNPESNINFGNVSTNNDMVTNDTYLSGLIARSGTQVIFYNSANTSGDYLNSDINNQYYFTYNKASSKSYTLPLFYIASLNSYLVSTTNNKNLEFVLLDWDTIVKLKDNAVYKQNIMDRVVAFGYGDTTFIASDGTICTGESAPGFLSPNSYSANPALNYVANSYAGHARYERISFKNLDVSSTSNFYRFFYQCSQLMYIDFDSLDFSNATSFFQMFEDCAKIEYIDFYYLNAPKVTLFGEMFYGCFRLKKIDLNIFDVSNASGYYGIGGFFANSGIDATDPEAIDLNLIDTSKCTSLYAFFQNSIKRPGVELVLPDNFVHAGITSVEYFFYNCSNLTKWNFDNCDFSGVSSISYFFYGCLGLTEITKDDLSFLTGKITSFYYTFCGCDYLESIDLSGISIDTLNSSSSVDFSSTFQSCDRLLKIVFPHATNSSDSFDLDSTFRYCYDIVHIDLYNLGRGRFSSLSQSFSDCNDLVDIEFGNTYCYSLSYLDYTFYNCYKLEYVDIYNLFSSNSWGSSGSYSLYYTFGNCYKLKVIDLRGFLARCSGDVSLSSTFVSCTSLETIIAPYYFFAMGYKAAANCYPFGGNTKLVGGSGTTYSSTNNASSTMFRPDGFSGSPGYLTIDWSYNMQSPSQTYYTCVSDTMANYLNRFFKANFSSNSAFQTSSATSFVIRYCDSNTYSSLSSSHGATLYSDTNTNTSFYYLYSSNTLSLFVNKPFYFASGKGYVNSSSNSILSSMIYGTSANSSTFKSFSMDGVYCGNLDLQYFMYSMSNLIEFRGLVGQTMFSSSSKSLYMAFAYCSNLPKISLNSLKMNNCSTANYLFYCDYYLVDIDMSFISFDSSTSTNFFQYMFYSTGTNSSTPLDVSFMGASLYSAYGSFFYNMFQGTSKSINTFDVRYIRFSYVFSGILSSVPYNVSTHLDFTGWKINSTTSLNYLFANSTLSEYKGLNTWKFGSSLTDVSYMLSSLVNASSIDLSGWDVSRVTNFNCLFAGSSNLTSIDLSGWDFASATNFSNMFAGNSKMEELYVDFNADNVTSMDYMFQGCQKIPEIDLSRVNVSKVTDLSYVFDNCFALESANVSNWDTSSCTKFIYLFNYCKKLTDLGNETNKLDWNTSKVTSMMRMFCECNVLPKLDLSSFDTSNVVSFDSMFTNCINICDMDMSNWKIGKYAFSSFSVPTLYQSTYTDLHSILKIRNLDLSDVYLSDNTLGTVLGMNFYHYIDASGWKLPTDATTLHNVLYSLYDLHAIDISNWEGWEHITTIDGVFISSAGGPFPSRNFTIYAEAGFDITGKIFTNENCEHIDLLGGSPETKLFVYVSNDLGQEYSESTESRTDKNKLKVATSISPLDGYFTNVAYRSPHWYS